MVVRGLVVVIELYRTLISPFRSPSCRFEPSCSRYAQQALERHGLRRGGKLADPVR
jgi:putative membrane protein insertion efficiency factor